MATWNGKRDPRERRRFFEREDRRSALPSFHETLYGDAPDRGERQRRFPAESGFCATQAVESRRPVFVGSFNELQEQFWRSASLAADGGYVSSATLPLLVEGTAIGVLAFNFTVPVNFDAEYQALLVSVAQHCAQALDRARLYDWRSAPGRRPRTPTV